MSENQAQQAYEKLTSGVEKLTSGVEKMVAEQTARYEAAVAELTKLQAKGVEQAQAWVNTATRAVQEQVSFAEQLGTEWRKAFIAASKSVTESFAPKA
jgi:ElaB/YqjD/DUF883 family membrane-anchored ribosome-binding protein